jgi:prenyltransferase beta subunit
MFHRIGFSSWLVLLFALPAAAQPPSAEQKKATLDYLYALQKPDGGFGLNARVPDSDLGATSSALRAIKYFGGEVKNKAGCEKFILSCFDASTGGFASRPKGMADVRMTAIGVMALHELAPPAKTTKQIYASATNYWIANAKAFEDVRIAAAGLDTIGGKLPKKVDWIAIVNQNRNADGTYGKAGNQPRDTGGAVAAILRLGGIIGDKDAVIKVMKDGQRPEGGWGKEGEKADLETTYRVMRSLYMLKAKPNLETLHAFIAKCRNDDGGYSVQPGQPSSVSATYFASIILKWAGEMK